MQMWYALTVISLFVNSCSTELCATREWMWFRWGNSCDVCVYLFSCVLCSHVVVAAIVTTFSRAIALFFNALWSGFRHQTTKSRIGGCSSFSLQHTCWGTAEKKKKKSSAMPGYCVVQGHHLMIVCNVGVDINGIALITWSTLVNFIPFNFQELGHLWNK